jgi:endonuclease-3
MNHSEARAQRLISFLQEVFEIHFAYDLEKLQKEGVKQAAKKLARYQATNDYVGAWVIQRSLGGHAIPLDGATLRCTRRLGLVEEGQEDLEAARGTLEHLVPKAKGLQFTDLISMIADEYCWEGTPNCGPCPLASECAYAQEHGVPAAAPAANGRRPKPR